MIMVLFLSLSREQLFSHMFPSTLAWCGLCARYKWLMVLDIWAVDSNGWGLAKNGKIEDWNVCGGAQNWQRTEKARSKAEGWNEENGIKGWRALCEVVNDDPSWNKEIRSIRSVSCQWDPKWLLTSTTGARITEYSKDWSKIRKTRERYTLWNFI